MFWPMNISGVELLNPKEENWITVHGVGINVNINIEWKKKTCWYKFHWLSSLILWNDIYPRSNRAAINHVRSTNGISSLQKSEIVADGERKKTRRSNFHFDGLAVAYNVSKTNQAIRTNWYCIIMLLNVTPIVFDFEVLRLSTEHQLSVYYLLTVNCRMAINSKHAYPICA